MASYYQRPLLPESCTDPTLGDKSTYNTLVRIAASWDGFALAFQAIMQYYGWQRVILMNDQALNSVCTFGSTAIINAMQGSPFQLITVIMKTAALTAADYNDYLTRAMTNGRGLYRLYVN